MSVKTANKVTIESAGDHLFDLDHIRREGGVDLITLLLETAGVDRRLRWQLRVDEKITGTSHTPPIHVTTYKPWCVYIKIKPGDNNTAHRCSLLVPDGSDQGYAKELHDRLRLVESTVNNKWRGSRRHDPVPEKTGQEELEVLPKNNPQTEPKFNAKKLLRDPEQIRFVVFAIYKLSKRLDIRTRDQFMDVLRSEMKWESASKHATGAIVSSLLKSDFIMQVVSGNKIIGYTLEDKGIRLVQDLIDKHEAAENTLQPKPTINTTKVLQSLGKVGEWFSTASKRLAEIEAEREMLLEQMTALNNEEKAICAVVEDPKIQTVLTQLTEVEVNYPCPKG